MKNKVFNFNINNEVRIRLTPNGYKILKDFYGKYNLSIPEKWFKPDSHGYIKEQLWTIMEIFGGHMGQCRPNPFDLNIILEIDENEIYETTD